MTEKFTFFWKAESPFSQWYPCEFIVENITFNCAEQFMMYKKALLFNDIESAEKILQSKTPKHQKILGRKVKNFVQTVWNQECKKIVYDGNHAKFSQNLNLKKHLLKTKGTILVEASPLDTLWGVGLSVDDPNILDPKKWKGKNYLGEVLTKLRDTFLEEEK